MALLDDLDLSKFIAPAGYTPPPMTTGALSPLAQAFSAQNVLPPGGLPQGGPAPAPQGPAPPTSGVGSGGISDPTTSGFSLLRGLSDPNLKMADGSQISFGPPPQAPAPQAPQGPAPDDTPEAPKGFLQRLTSPDPTTGVLFRDKMMALGQILQGDTKGAQATMENAQQRALMMQEMGLMSDVFKDGGEGGAAGAQGGAAGGAGATGGGMGMTNQQKLMAYMAMRKGDFATAEKIMHPTPLALRENAIAVNPVTGQTIAKGAPKTGVAEGYGWTADSDGNITWGAQRPMTYNDVLNLGKFQDQLKQEGIQNRIAAGHLAIAGGELGVHQAGERRQEVESPQFGPPQGFVPDK